MEFEMFTISRGASEIDCMDIDSSTFVGKGLCDSSLYGELDFSALPYEIYRNIFEFIQDDTTYAKLCLVNSTFYNLANETWREYAQQRQLLSEEASWSKLGKDWKWILFCKTRNSKNGPSHIKSDDYSYEGDLINGKRNGLGKETTIEGIYTGQFLDNLRHGYGLLVTNKGATYQGHWKCGKKSGKGEYLFQNGDKYVGDWEDDNKTGYGVYHFGTGKWDGDRYEGEWKNNKKNGKGVYMWRDGDKYIGEFGDDNFNGHGVYFFSCGDRYEGSWKSDKRSGYGVYIYHHGGKYEGNFSEGKRNGRGMFTWKDGDRYEGEWHFGSRRGKGTFYSIHGNVLQQTWAEPVDANYSVNPPPKYNY